MEEKVNRLCQRYGFSCDKIGKYIRVFSKKDAWYLINKNYDWHEKITLWHENNGKKTGIHKQKDFNKLVYVFLYMKKHDNKNILKHFI